MLTAMSARKSSQGSTPRTPAATTSPSQKMDSSLLTTKDRDLSLTSSLDLQTLDVNDSVELSNATAEGAASGGYLASLGEEGRSQRRTSSRTQESFIDKRTPSSQPPAGRGSVDRSRAAEKKLDTKAPDRKFKMLNHLRRKHQETLPLFEEPQR